MPFGSVVMKYKHIMLVFGASAVISLYLRLKQQLTTIDERGFVISAYTSDNFFLLIGILGLLAASVVSGCLTRRCPMRSPKVNFLLGSVSAILGGWMIFDSVTVSSPASVPAWQSVIMGILGVVSGVLFIAYGATCVVEFKIPRLAFIIPVFYWMMRLIWVFTALNTLALTTEHILLLLNCSAILIFMLQYAKLLNVVERDKSYKRIQVVGIASVLLSVDYALANLLLEFMGKRVSHNEGASSEILILLTALFIFVFMTSYFNQNNLKRRSRSNRRVISHPGAGKDSFYIGGSQ